jgi:hypothetical protein
VSKGSLGAPLASQAFGVKAQFFGLFRIFFIFSIKYFNFRGQKINAMRQLIEFLPVKKFPNLQQVRSACGERKLFLD